MADAGDPLWKMFKVCDRVLDESWRRESCFYHSKAINSRNWFSLFLSFQCLSSFLCCLLSAPQTIPPTGPWIVKEKKVNCYQVISIAKQVTFALAVAEAAYEFEHRDLHSSNILIKKTTDKYVVFCVNGKYFQMESCGVIASIIDSTFARYKISEYIVFFCSPHLLLIIDLLRLITASFPIPLQAILQHHSSKWLTR